MYEFFGDGTFDKVVVAIISSSSYGVNVFEGKYRVSGNRITLYDQMRGSQMASSWDEVYAILADPPAKDTPLEDSEHTFSRTAEGNLLLDDLEFSRLLP